MSGSITAGVAPRAAAPPRRLPQPPWRIFLAGAAWLARLAAVVRGDAPDDRDFDAPRPGGVVA